MVRPDEDLYQYSHQFRIHPATHVHNATYSLHHINKNRRRQIPNPEWRQLFIYHFACLPKY